VNFRLVPFAALLIAGCGDRPNAATTKSALGPPSESITLLAYNVLADRVRLEERLPAILELLRTANADVIALQEADDWLLEALEKQAWFREYFHATRTQGRLDAPGGQLLWSRFPIEHWQEFDLPGFQGRTVVVADLRVNGQKMSIANTHLESRLEDGPIRAKQLEFIFARLGEGDAALLGDLNFGDGAKPETSNLPNNFVDVWSALRSKEAGFTWNVETNPMAKAGSFPGEGRGRIDRIMVRSTRWKPKSVELVGDKPIAGAKDVFASDHFGLLATYELRR
jgi:tyrosyl-DNA phosphodiesterase 2